MVKSSQYNLFLSDQLPSKCKSAEESRGAADGVLLHLTSQHPARYINIDAAAVAPTRSLGMSRSSDPCFKKTLPAVCAGLMPTPSTWQEIATSWLWHSAHLAYADQHDTGSSALTIGDDGAGC